MADDQVKAQVSIEVDVQANLKKLEDAERALERMRTAHGKLAETQRAVATASAKVQDAITSETEEGRRTALRGARDLAASLSADLRKQIGLTDDVFKSAEKGGAKLQDLGKKLSTYSTRLGDAVSSSLAKVERQSSALEKVYAAGRNGPGKNVTQRAIERDQGEISPKAGFARFTDEYLQKMSASLGGEMVKGKMVPDYPVKAGAKAEEASLGQIRDIATGALSGDALKTLNAKIGKNFGEELDQKSAAAKLLRLESEALETMGKEAQAAAAKLKAVHDTEKPKAARARTKAVEAVTKQATETTKAVEATVEATEPIAVAAKEAVRKTRSSRAKSAAKASAEAGEAVAQQATAAVEILQPVAKAATENLRRIKGQARSASGQLLLGPGTAGEDTGAPAGGARRPTGGAGQSRARKPQGDPQFASYTDRATLSLDKEGKTASATAKAMQELAKAKQEVKKGEEQVAKATGGLIAQLMKEMKAAPQAAAALHRMMRQMEAASNPNYAKRNAAMGSSLRSVGGYAREASAGVRDLFNSNTGLLGQVKNVMGMAFSYQALQAVGSELVNVFTHLKGGIIEFNSMIEQGTVGFTTLFKNQERQTMSAARELQDYSGQLDYVKMGYNTAEQAAQGMINTIKQFANVTPFRFAELQDSALRMRAFGFELDEVLKYDSKTRQFTGAIVDVGNAVSALKGGGEAGADAFRRITYALGQMKQAGRVYQNDMMQLANAGIGGYKYIADALKKEISQNADGTKKIMSESEKKMFAELESNAIEAVRRLTTNGQISGEVAARAILQGLRADFGDGMTALSKTFVGALTTVADTSQSLVATAFNPLYEGIRDSVYALGQGLQADSIAKQARLIGYAMKEVVVVIGQIGARFIKISQLIFNDVIAPFKAAKGEVSSLSGVFSYFGKGVEVVAGFFENQMTRGILLATLSFKAFTSAVMANPLLSLVFATTVALGALKVAVDQNLFGIGRAIRDAGESLKPVVKIIQEQLGPALAEIGAWAFQYIIGGLVLGFKALLPIIQMVANFFSALVQIVRPFGSIIGGIVAMLVGKFLIGKLVATFTTIKVQIARATVEMLNFSRAIGSAADKMTLLATRSAQANTNNALTVAGPLMLGPGKPSRFAGFMGGLGNAAKGIGNNAMGVGAALSIGSGLAEQAGVPGEITGLVNNIGGALMGFGLLKNIIPAGTFTRVIKDVGGMLKSLKTLGGVGFNAIKDGLTSVGGQLKALALAAFRQIVAGLSSVIIQLRAFAAAQLAPVAAQLTKFSGAVRTLAAAGWARLLSSMSSFKETLMAIKGASWSQWTVGTSLILARLKDMAALKFQTIATGLASNIDKFKEFASLAFFKIRFGLVLVMAQLKNLAAQAYEQIVAGITRLIGSLRSLSIQTMWSSVTNGLSSLKGGLMNLTKISWTSIVNGLKNLALAIRGLSFTGVAASIGAAVGSAWAAVTGFFASFGGLIAGASLAIAALAALVVSLPADLVVALGTLAVVGAAAIWAAITGSNNNNNTGPATPTFTKEEKQKSFNDFRAGEREGYKNYQKETEAVKGTTDAIGKLLVNQTQANNNQERLNRLLQIAQRELDSQVSLYQSLAEQVLMAEMDPYEKTNPYTGQIEAGLTLEEQMRIQMEMGFTQFENAQGITRSFDEYKDILSSIRPLTEADMADGQISLKAVAERLKLDKERRREQERLKAIAEADYELGLAQLEMYDESKDPLEKAVRMRNAQKKYLEDIDKLEFQGLENLVDEATNSKKMEAATRQLKKNLEDIQKAQQLALQQMRDAFTDFNNDIADILSDDTLSGGQKQAAILKRFTALQAQLKTEFGVTETEVITMAKSLNAQLASALSYDPQITPPTFGAEMVAMLKSDAGYGGIIKYLEAALARVAQLSGAIGKAAANAQKDSFIMENKDAMLNMYRAGIIQAGTRDKLPNYAWQGYMAHIAEMAKTGNVDTFKALWNKYAAYAGFSKLAAGGIASGNQMHLVGEKGPELFIPQKTGLVLNNSISSRLLGMLAPRGMQMAGAGGVTINVNNPVIRSDADIRKLAEEISRAQASQFRTQGGRLG